MSLKVVSNVSDQSNNLSSIHQLIFVEKDSQLDILFADIIQSQTSLIEHVHLLEMRVIFLERNMQNYFGRVIFIFSLLRAMC
jgi:hypothetical protein